MFTGALWGGIGDELKGPAGNPTLPPLVASGGVQMKNVQEKYEFCVHFQKTNVKAFSMNLA